MTKIIYNGEFPHSHAEFVINKRRPMGGIGTESALITPEYQAVEAGLKLASQLPQLSGNLDKIITSSKTR